MGLHEVKQGENLGLLHAKLRDGSEDTVGIFKEGIIPSETLLAGVSNKLHAYIGVKGHGRLSDEKVVVAVEEAAGAATLVVETTELPGEMPPTAMADLIKGTLSAVLQQDRLDVAQLSPDTASNVHEAAVTIGFAPDPAGTLVYHRAAA